MEFNITQSFGFVKHFFGITFLTSVLERLTPVGPHGFAAVAGIQYGIRLLWNKAAFGPLR
jgi:hypothetical protein